MSLIGFCFGLIAAFLQSVSYLFSKRYIEGYGKSFSLSVYSQIAMGVLGALTLLVLHDRITIPLTWMTLLFVVATNVTYVAGQISFFCSLKYIEASRLSSFMSMKIIVITLISIFVLQKHVSGMQWVGVLFCAASGFGMNFAGGRCPMKGLLFLIPLLVSFAVSDLCCGGSISNLHGSNFVLCAIGAAGLNYMTLGFASLFLLPFLDRKERKRQFIAAAPFGMAWFSAMVFLYVAFGECGVIFGNILQSTRGIISVVLGVIVMKLGFSKIEPAAGARVWLRRALMALLMIVAIAFYSLGKS